MSDGRQATDRDVATGGLAWSAEDGRMLDGIIWVLDFTSRSGSHVPRFLGEIPIAEQWGSYDGREPDDTNFLPVLEQSDRASVVELNSRLRAAIDFLPRLARFQVVHADRISAPSFKATRRVLFILHRQVSLCALYLEDPPDFLNGASWAPFSGEASLYSRCYSDGYAELGGLATKLRAIRGQFPDPPPVVSEPEAEVGKRQADWLVKTPVNPKWLILTASDGATRVIEFSNRQVEVLLYLRDKGKRSPGRWVDLKQMKSSLMPGSRSPVLKSLTQEERPDRESFVDACLKTEPGRARLVQPDRLGTIGIIPATGGPPPRPSRHRAPNSGPTC